LVSLITVWSFVFIFGFWFLTWNILNPIQGAEGRAFQGVAMFIYAFLSVFVIYFWKFMFLECRFWDHSWHFICCFWMLFLEATKIFSSDGSRFI
jgi:hypothetical protein